MKRDFQDRRKPAATVTALAAGALAPALSEVSGALPRYEFAGKTLVPF
jgi:hypothetical protein